MRNKIKLTPKQKEVLLELRLRKELKNNSARQANMAKTLVEKGVAEYNSHYNGIVLTELGKTIEIN